MPSSHPLQDLLNILLLGALVRLRHQAPFLPLIAQPGYLLEAGLPAEPGVEVQKAFAEVGVVGEGVDDVRLTGVFLVDAVDVLQAFGLVLLDPLLEGLEERFGSFGQKRFFVVDFLVRVGLDGRVVGSALGLLIILGIHLPPDGDAVGQPQNLSANFDKGNLDQIAVLLETIVILDERRLLCVLGAGLLSLLELSIHLEMYVVVAESQAILLVVGSKWGGER